MPLNIVVEGCGHGQLDEIYESVQALARHSNRTVDLVICCGDFQAIRNKDDLCCMACPEKYRRLGSFWEYYAGRKVAPYPTLFIGGNHEATNYLRELYYGGWVAPKIYFLGYSGVVRFGGIRIGGVSGIYKSRDYLKHHFEEPPYSPSTIKSAYHVRCEEVMKLMALQGGKMDVFLSHDWPCGIERYGDVASLIKKKKYFREDIANNCLGSQPNMKLLQAIRPAYWFSAHLHCKFAAVVPHLDGTQTRFLSLDKCIPGRHFLQLVEFPDADGPKSFMYDDEWLAVIKGQSRHSSLSGLHQNGGPLIPSPPIARPSFIQIQEIRRLFEGDNLLIPENFEMTAPPHSPNKASEKRGTMPIGILENPQTQLFVDKMGIGQKREENPEAIDLSTSSED
jgi:lariat debranching enzyme